MNELNDTPNSLIPYSDLSFKGCDFGGKGFVLSLEEKNQFIQNIIICKIIAFCNLCE